MKKRVSKQNKDIKCDKNNICLPRQDGRLLFLCLKYRGKMGQIKDFAVLGHYGQTATDGSKSSKCSSQKQSSSFI